MQDIADHGHDFGLFVTHEVEVFPKWILARPQNFGELLIDDHDKSGIGIVAQGEFTAAKQWNAHTLEISGIDCVNASQRLLAALKWRTQTTPGKTRARC